MPIINTNIAETISITENGQHDVAKYTTANVNVAGLPRTVDNNGVLQFGVLPNDFLGGATDLGDWVFYSAYYNSASGYLNNVSGAVNMSSLTTVSGTKSCYYMFRGCTGITSVDLSSLTTVSGDNALYHAFHDCTGITSVDLSNLTTVSGASGCYAMFQGCTGITSVDLSSLTTISGTYGCNSMFSGCTGITSVDLHNLTNAEGCQGMFNGCTSITGAIDLSSVTSGYFNTMFRNCTGITSIDLSSLTTLTGSSSAMNGICSGCTSLTSIDLSSLTSLDVSSAFSSAFENTALTTLSFPAITTTSFGSKVNQFNNMCKGLTNITIHFPSNVQSVIEGLTGYSTTAPFGATSGTVLFDLPATA